MRQPKDRTLLRKVLELADELSILRARQREAVTVDEGLKWGQQANQQVEELGELLRSFTAEGPLQQLVQRYRLGPVHVLMMVELLRQRLRENDPSMSGRELIGKMFEGSFERLEAIRLLSPGSRLLATHIVEPDFRAADEDAELLDLRYRLGERALRTLLRALSTRRQNPAQSSQQVKPYRGHLAYVIDLRRLTDLYRKRAAKVFHHEDWTELEDGLPESVALINREIARSKNLIKQRLDATPGREKFPLVKLQKKARLNDEHLVVLVALVFRELTQGNPYVDAVDLVKLVSRSEEDLIRKRKLFSESSPLISHQLVFVEEVLHDKDLSGEVYVPNSVVDWILGGKAGGKQKIDSDTRREFRKFLSDLDDSEDFFKKL